VWLLWKEGGDMFNDDPRFPPIDPNARDLGARVMVGLFQYLFEDANGITSNDLSRFTAFFNPNGGVFDAQDWSLITNRAVPEKLFVSQVDKYWGQVPYTDNNGRIVDRWWDNKETTPCGGCYKSFSVKLPYLNKIDYFGYLP
jgi:hypothetical protein